MLTKGYIHLRKPLQSGKRWETDYICVMMMKLQTTFLIAIDWNHAVKMDNLG